MHYFYLVPLLFTAVVNAGLTIVTGPDHQGIINPAYDATCKKEASRLCPVDYKNPNYNGDKWQKYYMKCLCEQWRTPSHQYTCQAGCYRDIFQGGSTSWSNSVDALCDGYCNYNASGACEDVREKCT